MRPQIYVSLTTIAARVGCLDRVLGSLLRQTLEPDRIILNVSLSPYMADSGIQFESLPEQTRKWVLAGNVEMYYCENTGPYRKIIPVLKRFGFSNYYIATADDDVIYPPRWLEVLSNTATSTQSVSAFRCRVMSFAGDRLAPYNTWPLLLSSGNGAAQGVQDGKPSLLLFPTGRDGVIYHAGWFEDFAALLELQGLAPGQDDIAFKFATLMAGVGVMRAPREHTGVPIGSDFEGLSSNSSCLWSLNSVGKNDEVLGKVTDWCQRNRSFRLLTGGKVAREERQL